MNKQNVNPSTSKIKFGVLIIVYECVKIKYNYSFDVYQMLFTCVMRGR